MSMKSVSASTAMVPDFAIPAAVAVVMNIPNPASAAMYAPPVEAAEDVMDVTAAALVERQN